MVRSEGLVVGEAETVGYRYIPGIKGSRPPIRILYPASSTENGKGAAQSWFQEHGGFRFYANGYFQLFALYVLGDRYGTLLHRILSPIISSGASILSFCSRALGWNNLHLPAGLLSVNAPPCAVDKNNKKYPLIVFSHGLTNTGQENLLLLSSWAKQGFVVASVHHTDGSSNRVRMQTDGTQKEEEDLFFDQGPPVNNYDADFRPKQVLHRSQEMKQAIDFMGTEMKDVADLCRVDKVLVAGFSFGAATAALTATLYPKIVQGLVLLDGWFYIDNVESVGIEFEFPQQAFQSSISMPSLFINSEMFSSIPKIYDATLRLSRILKTKSTDVHVLKGTNHNNFSDVFVWFPNFLLRKLHIIGSADPRAAYQDTIRLTLEFLKRFE
eukprot:scaffold918_cov126-Cylindrotheca_fusiformis.AAC.44